MASRSKSAAAVERLLLLLALILAWSPLAATPLYDEYIEVRVGFSGNPFFAVRMNDAETPWLPLTPDLLSKLLELEGTCRLNDPRCTLRLPDGRQFWLEPGAGSHGEQGRSGTLLPASALIPGESHWWIHYEALAQWLPLTVNWSVNDYRLVITPGYRLLKDLDAEYARQRAHARQVKQQGQYLQSLPTTLVSPSPVLEVGYQASLRQTSQSQPNFQGSVRTAYSQGPHRVHLAAEKNDGRRPLKLTQALWQWQQLPQNRQWRAGNLILRSSPLVSNQALALGVNWGPLLAEPEADYFYRRRQTVPDSAVDIYRNGRLVQTTQADDLGWYQVELEQVAGGDLIELQEFTGPGRREIHRYQLANNRRRLLPGGQTRADAWLGRLKEGGLVGRWHQRYGARHNLSLGLAGEYWQLGSGDETHLWADVNWRPWRNLGVDLDLGLQSKAWQLELNWLMQGRKQFQLQTGGQQLGATALPLRNEVSRWLRWDASNGLERWRLHHSYRWDDRNGIDTSVSANRAWQGLNTGFGLGLLQANPGSEFNWQGQINATLVPLSQNLLRIETGHKQSPYLALQWRYRTTGDRWQLDGNLNWRADTGWSPTLASHWKLNKRITASLSLEQQVAAFTLTYRDGLKRAWHQPNVEYPEFGYQDIGRGTLHGVIHYPDYLGGEPIAQVEICVQRRCTLSDEQGRYELHGLSANQRLLVQLNDNTLPIDLVQVNKHYFFTGNPGFVHRYDIPLVVSSGFDGVVAMDGLSGVRLQLHNPSNDQLTPLPLDREGFFWGEGFVPGTYQLQLVREQTVIHQQALIIAPGQEWLSDLRVSPRSPAPAVQVQTQGQPAVQFSQQRIVRQR